MSHPSEPVVVVTLTQIYGEMQAMHSEVRDMRTELKANLTDTADHETRIRSLERKVWMASGVAALFGAGGIELIRMITKS